MSTQRVAVTRIRTWVASATTKSTNQYTITAIGTVEPGKVFAGILSGPEWPGPVTLRGALEEAVTLVACKTEQFLQGIPFRCHNGGNQQSDCRSVTNHEMRAARLLLRQEKPSAKDFWPAWTTMC